jgi:hypothetical protein
MRLKSYRPWLLVPLALWSLGCGGQNDSEDQNPPAASTPAPAPATTEASQDAHAGGGHAAANVVPGSYEDWCSEHAVPESMCTRCNVELVAAFKASGDWCAEHGLPESQCLACNPNLEIKRPPKPEEK